MSSTESDLAPAQAPSTAPLATRQAALAVLDRVLRGGQRLDDTLVRHEEFLALEPRDRAFVRMLLATTLRRLGEIDAILDRFVTTPLPPRAHLVRDLLRLGAAQLLFLGTPAHAAVDTAVSIAAKLEMGAYKRLTNAVLRALSREEGAVTGELTHLNTPRWLWETWAWAYGEETARRIATAHLEEAPLDLSVKADAAGWATRLEGSVLANGTIRRVSGGRVEDLPGYAEGAWWVQDVAASLPARLLGNIAGKHVVDLCAAPGGKTLQLLAAGARVTAVDLSAKRMARVADNLKRTGFEAELVTTDASTWRPDTPPDAILLDAPCSATGTLRRHPDIAWLKGLDDVGRLANAQARLLQAAIEMAPPGGTIVYAVCSLQPEEGDMQVEAALQRGDVERVPVSPADLAAGDLRRGAAGWTSMITRAGDLRTLPFLLGPIGGMDGFYAARLRKRR